MESASFFEIKEKCKVSYVKNCVVNSFEYGAEYGAK